MTRRSLGLAGWGLACLAAMACAQTPAEVTLKDRGLTREKGTFVHSSEQALLDKVEELRGAYSRLNAAQYKLAEADQNTAMIAELGQQAAYLQQEKNAIAAQGRGIRMPRGMGNVIRRNIQAQQQVEQQAINQTNQQIAALKKAAPSPQVRKALQDDIAKRREEMIQAATEGRKLIDETYGTYETLAKDEAVKAALAAVKATTTDAIKLGPSKEFHAAERVVASAERMLGLKSPADAKKSAHKKAKH